MANPPVRLWPKLGKRRGRWLGVLLLLTLLLSVALLFRWRTLPVNSWFQPTGSAAAQAQTDVQLAEVTRGAIIKRLLLDGELRAVRARVIFSNTSEETKIVYLPPEGSLVKPGDRLVELDSSTILTKIKEVEERIFAADNEIIRTRSTQESALREMEVELSKLWMAYEQAKVKARVPAEVVPRREYQDNVLALEKAKTEYENQLTKIEQRKKEQAAELQVKIIEREKLNAQIEQAKNSLDSMNIKAPAEGMVIYNEHWNERRKLQVGDAVWGGLPIVRLPDLTEMEVLAQVNEVDGPRLSIGNRAQIRLDSFPDLTITGAVKEIAQTASKASWMGKTKVFRVVISLDQTRPEMMKPGMSAQVSIVLAEQEVPLLVPRSAVQFVEGAAQVLRLEGARERRPVAVTIIFADPLHYALADKGALKAGDRILSRWEK
jgi:HlyD family secretion protein